ncbi:hypothetical protein [Botrimarina sp.]|uniref:hypothetical protein n=1 Tax=Botrimarina sp. TaxID=2795802 RepID=UPI0032EC4303
MIPSCRATEQLRCPSCRRQSAKVDQLERVIDRLAVRLVELARVVARREIDDEHARWVSETGGAG